MNQTGLQYREMAGTELEQPYPEMRKLIRLGAIGQCRMVRGFY